MKNITIIALTVLLMSSVAAIAADGSAPITKGKKIYQTSSARKAAAEAKAANAQAPQTAEDMMNIQPAAGAENPSETDEAFHKEMRLPRKGK